MICNASGMNSSYSVKPSAFMSAAAMPLVNLLLGKSEALLQAVHESLELCRVQELVAVTLLEQVLDYALHRVQLLVPILSTLRIGGKPALCFQEPRRSGPLK